MGFPLNLQKITKMHSESTPNKSGEKWRKEMQKYSREIRSFFFTSVQNGVMENSDVGRHACSSYRWKTDWFNPKIQINRNTLYGVVDF